MLGKGDEIFGLQKEHCTMEQIEAKKIPSCMHVTIRDNLGIILLDHVNTLLLAPYKNSITNFASHLASCLLLEEWCFSALQLWSVYCVEWPINRNN